MTGKNEREKISSQAGKALLVQNHQVDAIKDRASEIDSSMGTLSSLNDTNANELDELLRQATLMLEQQEMDPFTLTEQDGVRGGALLDSFEDQEIALEKLGDLETIDVDSGNTWDKYMDQVESYAWENGVDLTQDPFDALLSPEQKAEIEKRIKEDYLMGNDVHCDKYDYLIAAFSGVASGLIDVFFVGTPLDSKLGNWTNKETDKIVEKFAKWVQATDKKKGTSIGKNSRTPIDGIASAIGYLEERFNVNYDARTTSDFSGIHEKMDVNSAMSSSNHHLKSLGHSPDIIGLFFSILDQFTGKATFVLDGKLVRIVPKPKKKEFELQGKTFQQKIFFGFCNWIGHIMSDIAGSSGNRGHDNGKYGMGVPIPFYELFLFCDFGEFDVNVGTTEKRRIERMNFADLMTKVYEKGYDARFGAAMAIPVFINELLIRSLWAIKSHYYHKRTWKESIPFGNKPELRRMLVVGHGALCLVDGTDAAIRSGGDALSFALHINIIAWNRFAIVAFKEIRILYKEDALDTDAMDRDLDLEWRRLYVVGGM